MGFNTVAFVLNDYIGNLEKSPTGYLWLLRHPPMGQSDRDYTRRLAQSVAHEAGEPPLHPQALEVLPTFHANCTSFFMAGGNRIDRLEELRRTKARDGKPATVTIALPGWCK